MRLVGRFHNRAFTRTELVTVLAVVAAFVALLIPTLSKVRQTKSRETCGQNLQAIQHAKKSWALAEKAWRDEVPRDLVLFGPGAFLKEKPHCPDGGTYTIGAVKDLPKCSVSGHEL